MRTDVTEEVRVQLHHVGLRNLFDRVALNDTSIKRLELHDRTCLNDDLHACTVRIFSLQRQREVHS